MQEGGALRPAWLARAGAWARRPQTAMGAIFLMTAASSALVLARKHRSAGASLSVREQGVPVAVEPPPNEAEARASIPPEPASARPAQDQVRPRSAPPTGHETATSVEGALALEQRGNREGAIAALRALGEAGDGRARFLQGKAEKELSGCARARETFARVGGDPTAGAVTFDARLEEGRCARLLGDADGARRALETLLDVPSHRERALTELRELD